MPFIIYIAIAGAFTFPSIMEWPQNDHLSSLLQLEDIARWAFTTIISHHSGSSYLPVEEGRTVFEIHFFGANILVVDIRYMKQIVLWILYTIIDYRNLVKDVARENVSNCQRIVNEIVLLTW
jgi:hypothetical protein